MTAPLRWSTLAIACVLTAAGIAALWFWIPPVYFTNDDVIYRLQLTGEDVPGGNPTPDLLFPHAALTVAAVKLQALVPGVPAWDLILSVSFVLALGGLGALVWNALDASRFQRAVALILMLAASIQILLGIQFTISAVLCGCFAVLLVMGDLFQRGSPRLGAITASTVFLLAGYLVRPMGAEAGALVTMTLLVIPALASRNRLKRVVGLGTTGVVVAGTFAVLNVADRSIYEWRGEGEYYRYHWQVLDLIEWGGSNSSQQVEAVRAATGWTETEWDLMRRRWGVDSNRFGYTQLAKATEAAEATGPGPRLAGAVSRLDDVIADSPRTLLPPLMLAGVLALTAALCFATPVGLLLAGAQLMVFLSTCVVIAAAFKEIPFQLLAPLQLCLIATVLVSLAEWRRPASRLGVVIALVVACLLAGREGVDAYGDSRIAEDTARSTREQVQEVLATRPSLLVLHADAFPYESWWRPFRQPPVRLPFIHLVWDNQDPRLQRFLEERGLRPLFPGICADPSILLIANPDRLDIVTRALAEQHGLAVEWAPVFLGTIRAWRCAPRTPGNASTKGSG